MMIRDILRAFAVSPLLTRIEKRREGALRTITISGQGLDECATWGTACAEPPPFLAPLAATQRAGLCQVRRWDAAWLICWADGEHVCVCEEVAR